MIACYLRTSVWKMHKVSIEAQREIVESKTPSKEIVYFIDRGYSGSTIDRPDFLKLKEWIESSRASRKLYVSRYDRISRNVQDALNFLELCQNHNVEVVSVLEPIPSSLGNKKAAELLFVQILFSLAEFTRSVTIENVNNALAQKKVEQKLLSAKAPFGYVYQRGKLIPDEEKSLIVQLVFNLYTSTEMGYKRITNQLNKKGYRFKGRLFKNHHVAQILKNPIYTGKVGSKSRNLNSYQSQQVTPIISHDIFQQATNKRLSRKVTQQNSREYPLRKKIICPECTKKLTPRKQVSRGNDYHYYVCSNETCGQCLINADEIEKITLKTISDYLSQDEPFKELIVALKNQIEEINQVQKSSFEDLNRQKQKLLKSFENKKIDHEVLKQQLEIINHDQVNITKITLSQDELSKRLKLLLRLSNMTSKELIWPLIDYILLNKNKRIQEVIVYGIRIQSNNT